MAKRLLVLWTMALSGCSGGCSGPTGPAVVKIKGIEVRCEYHRDGLGRAEVAVAHPRLVDTIGILVGWGGDRIQHYSSARSGAAFEVLFLAADGTIVERAVLKENSDAGITSTKEASWALMLAEGWSARHNAADADRVELGPGVTARAPAPPPTIKVGGLPVRVEIADTPARRTRGLMHRQTMSAEDGMVFLFPAEQSHQFWMGNCHYALDIAYFDRNGKFVNVVPMDPYPNPATDTEPKAHSSGKAQFVVETHKGWFRAKGLVDADGRATKDVVLEMPPEVRRYIPK
jgi:hypothetical protein